MPQTNSAKKALRVALRRRAINDRWRTRLRSSIKELKTAMASGKKDAALTALQVAQKMLDRAARHHIITRQTAARRKSRFAHAIAKLT